MAQVRIKLINPNYMAKVYFVEDVTDFVRNNRDAYTTLPAMTLDKTGFDAAEEMFDLTNNPYRDDERQQVYGNGRSLSVGDIVEVDGVEFLCASFGWKIVDSEAA